MTAVPSGPRAQPCGCRSAYVHDHGCTKFGPRDDRAEDDETTDCPVCAVNGFRHRPGCEVAPCLASALAGAEARAVARAQQELRAAADSLEDRGIKAVVEGSHCHDESPQRYKWIGRAVGFRSAARDLRDRADTLGGTT